MNSSEPSSDKAIAGEKRPLSQMSRQERKQLKKLSAESSGVREPGSIHCSFFMARKRRLCSATKANGSDFCPNHSIPANNPGLPPDFVLPGSRKFVPCPIYPAHSIREDRLAFHVTVCSEGKKNEMLKQLPYYKENINQGNVSSDVVESLREFRRLLKTPGHLSACEGLVNFKELFQKMKRFVDTILRDDDRVNYSAVRVEDDLIRKYLDSVNEGSHSSMSTPSRFRHEAQQCSIVGHMSKLGMLRSSENDEDDFTVIEYGAGRGMLSLTLENLLGKYKMVLIDRARVRGKAETDMRRDSTKESWMVRPGREFVTRRETVNGLPLSARFCRINADIANLNLRRLSQLAEWPGEMKAMAPTHRKKRNVVVMGKHLCGGATDMTLRSVINTFSPNSNLSDDCAIEDSDSKVVLDESLQSEVVSLRGVAIATCCHHRCDYESFIAKNWFSDVFGGSPLDFEVLRVLSAWACMGDKAKESALDVPDTEVSDNEETEKQLNEDFPSSTFQTSMSHSVDSMNEYDCDWQIGIDRFSQNRGDFHPQGTNFPVLPDFLFLNDPACTTFKSIVENLSRPQRIAIGRAAKRIIDYGRMVVLGKALKNVKNLKWKEDQFVAVESAHEEGGSSEKMDAGMLHYCSKHFTLENCLLFANIPSRVLC